MPHGAVWTISGPSDPGRGPLALACGGGRPGAPGSRVRAGCPVMPPDHSCRVGGRDSPRGTHDSSPSGCSGKPRWDPYDMPSRGPATSFIAGPPSTPARHARHPGHAIPVIQAMTPGPTCSNSVCFYRYWMYKSWRCCVHKVCFSGSASASRTRLAESEPTGCGLAQNRPIERAASGSGS